MIRRNMVLAYLLAGGLSGCVAAQTGENTVEMANSVSRIREIQVLRNIATAISDHDMVPSQILLSTGQATVATGATPSFKFPNFDFSKSTREFDIGATDTWTAQWQFSSVTNADDLRRLRNLYVLAASTDAQYDELADYFARHPELATKASDTDNAQSTVVQAPQYLESFLHGLPSTDHGEAALTTDAQIGSGAGTVPLWQQALKIMRTGDSIGCKLYQEPRLASQSKDQRGIPFRRWLFWRHGSGSWLPSTPDTEPTSLGQYGDWEIGTTSRACFDDFVILVQGQTPAAEKQSSGGAKIMLNPSP